MHFGVVPLLLSPVERLGGGDLSSEPEDGGSRNGREKDRVAIRFKVVSERKKTYRRVRAAFSVHRIRSNCYDE